MKLAIIRYIHQKVKKNHPKVKRISLNISQGNEDSYLNIHCWNSNSDIIASAFIYDVENKTTKAVKAECIKALRINLEESYAKHNEASKSEA